MRFCATWEIAIVASDEPTAEWVKAYFTGRSHWDTVTVARVVVTSVQWLSNVDGQDMMVSPVHEPTPSRFKQNLEGKRVTVRIVFAVTRVGSDGLPPPSFTTWLRSSVADHHRAALCVVVDAAPSTHQANILLYWLWAEMKGAGLPSVRFFREPREKLAPCVWDEFSPLTGYHPDYTGYI
jgi:hypothetical protein